MIAICVGSASSFFLVALDRATAWREDYLWIIAFLPIGGLLISLLYHYIGCSVEAGNNLLLDTTLVLPNLTAFQRIDLKT